MRIAAFTLLYLAIKMHFNVNLVADESLMVLLSMILLLLLDFPDVFRHIRGRGMSDKYWE